MYASAIYPVPFFHVLFVFVRISCILKKFESFSLLCSYCMILCYATLCTISAHRLQVLSLTGNIGEFVRLVQKVESASWAPKWLSSLQSSLKTTLALMLQATVQTRLEEGTRKLCVQSNFQIWLRRCLICGCSGSGYFACDEARSRKVYYSQWSCCPNALFK